MAATLGSTKLFWGPLCPGMNVSWVSLHSASSSGRLFLPRICEHSSLPPSSSSSCSTSILCSAAPHSAPERNGGHWQGRNPRVEGWRSELPWQVRAEEGYEEDYRDRKTQFPWKGRDAHTQHDIHSGIQSGHSGPLRLQMTPWDQTKPQEIEKKEEQQPQQGEQEKAAGTQSHMLNIVGKLRALEAREIKRQHYSMLRTRRFTATSMAAAYKLSASEFLAKKQAGSITTGENAASEITSPPQQQLGIHSSDLEKQEASLPGPPPLESESRGSMFEQQRRDHSILGRGDSAVGRPPAVPGLGNASPGARGDSTAFGTGGGRQVARVQNLAFGLGAPGGAPIGRGYNSASGPGGLGGPPIGRGYNSQSGPAPGAPVGRGYTSGFGPGAPGGRGYTSAFGPGVPGGPPIGGGNNSALGPGAPVGPQIGRGHNGPAAARTGNHYDNVNPVPGAETPTPYQLQGRGWDTPAATAYFEKLHPTRAPDPEQTKYFPDISAAYGARAGDGFTRYPDQARYNTYRAPAPGFEAGSGKGYNTFVPGSYSARAGDRVSGHEIQARSYSTTTTPGPTSGFEERGGAAAFTSSAIPSSTSASQSAPGVPGSSSSSGEQTSGARYPWEGKPDPIPQPPKSPCMAELTIPDLELRRLQRIALRITRPVLVGFLGITKAVVQDIHRRWQRCEIVKVRCQGPAALNMKKTHEELETKTGGLVIWRTGGMAVIYRGKSYFSRVENETIASMDKFKRRRENLQAALEGQSEEGRDDWQSEYVPPGGPERPKVEDCDIESAYLDEIDAILEDLGPRYDDWIGKPPVPVDADLLPPAVRGYRPPLRLLPYKALPSLSSMERQVLVRLSKDVTPHFVIGRNRGLQGLADGILKLWQKSEVVKVGLKRGVEHTRRELIAEELQRLTGGAVIDRDRHSLTIYRGKDFLPASVAEVLQERERNVRKLLDEEDMRRIAAVESDEHVKPTTAGTYNETMELRDNWEAQRDAKKEADERNRAALLIKLREQRRLERKLAMAISKKRKADLKLQKLEVTLRTSEYPRDRETITDEERHMFQKLGMKMHANMNIGIRGVFDGVIENMHQHWTYRELVKLIVKENDINIAIEVGKMLEQESGGILVSVLSIKRGQAIILYRGKNYQRPPDLRPRTLLTKRNALKRYNAVLSKTDVQNHMVKLETLIVKLRNDYDFFLKDQMSPDAPQSGLYKLLGEEYQSVEAEKDEEEKFLEQELSGIDTDEDEDGSGTESASEEEDEPFRVPREGEKHEETESDWDLDIDEDDDDEQEGPSK